MALIRTNVLDEHNHLLHQGTVILCSVLQLLITANIVPSALILYTLMMEAIHFSEMLVLTRATQRRIPEDSILNMLCLVASSYIN
jgi:hypothetical protein